MAHKHPQLEKLYQLRRALSVLRKFSLHLGGDGRVHCNLRPFASITGRNQPSTTAYPFGLPACLSGLIKPKPGSGLAYIDFRQEEFAIAAALSNDPNMIEAYKSGDPYLTFGKQAGLIPEDATKQSHSKDRARIKQLTLAVQYCMSPWGLARKLDCTTLEAEELLNLHKRTYRTFWEFIENFNNTAWLNMTTTTVLGWPLNLSHNTNPRTVQNFLMQATASDILRLACCIANDYGVKVCATVHDALLIESNLEKLAEDAAATYEAIRRAAEYVLGGFVLKADIKLIRYPERYQDEADTVMWDTLMRELGRLKNEGETL